MDHSLNGKSRVLIVTVLGLLWYLGCRTGGTRVRGTVVQSWEPYAGGLLQADEVFAGRRMQLASADSLTQTKRGPPIYHRAKQAYYPGQFC